jgi:tetratricopeptide (TPR) repeat protein
MFRFVRNLATFVAGIALAGCATWPDLPPPASGVFRDAWFTTSDETAAAIAADPFALTGAMQAWLDTEVVPQFHRRGLLRPLVDSLYRGNTLKLVYDAERTRSAAEAFEARAGNCLSLVILTAAFAKPLGLYVQYQLVDNGGVWERNGDLDVRIAHVNISLAEPATRVRTRDVRPLDLTVDFMSEPEREGALVTAIDQARVLAMYRNNRGVEALVDGRIDDAHAWVRAALQADERFADAWNSLAVVYGRRAEQPASAPAAQVSTAIEAALHRALAIDPGYTSALGNLANLLQREGRGGEAAAIFARLRRIEPVPPLAALDQGTQALRAGDARSARRIFERALRHEPGSHALHHGLAIALLQTGDRAAAARELERAREASGTRAQRALYAAKLEWLRGAGSTGPGERADDAALPVVN